MCYHAGVAGNRSYGEQCGVARSLDVIGERWALLIVRELLLGPKRFNDLLAGLPGASPNVISQRLRDLVEDGVIAQRELPPPARVRVYELTDWGRELEPVVVHLGRWGGRAPLPEGAHAGLDSVLVAIQATADPARVTGRYELRIGADTFTIDGTSGSVRIRRGTADQPDAVATINPDVFFALVRTGTRESRQKGITYLAIDAHAPGVQVRPLRDLTGGHLFAEVFFDDVRVPAANRIGEENGGWPLARTSLGHERAAGALNQAAMYRRVLTELEELARERGQLADPLVRDRLVDLEIRVRIIRYNAQRTIGDILATGEAGAGSSVSRLLITAFEQDIHEFAVDMLGPAGLLGKTAPQAVQRSRWLLGFLRTRASTIGAGTREIQLNTVAEQVLGLPHDPGLPAR